MRRMGLQALCPQPDTSKRHPQHKVYPSLLRKVSIRRANQVWALDTTYIPMARGVFYLTAVVDGIRPAKSSCGGEVAQGCSCPRHFIADTWTLQESNYRADGHGGGMRRSSESGLCRHVGNPACRSRPLHWPTA